MKFYYKYYLAFFILCNLVYSLTNATESFDKGALRASLQEMLNEEMKNDPTVPGGIIYISAPDLKFMANLVAGFTDFRSGKRLSPKHPVRLASNTKTYVAAAVLRLWEDGQLVLDDSISQYILPASNELLRSGGYDTDKITLLQLLNHTSGLFDYAESEPFDRAVLAKPEKTWSRREQLKGIVSWGRPLSEPGEDFNYSDSGYILIGEILENITGKPLPVAVRDLLNFEKLGIKHTWWESLEPVPSGIKNRAHQYWGKFDTYNWNPSFDLYGGGGLVGPVDELGHFMMKLFSGDVFEKTTTLSVMITGSLPQEDKALSYRQLQNREGYGMGIRTITIDDQTAYEHSGVFGTTAAYFPELNVSIAVAATQLLSDTNESILRQAIGLLKESHQ